MSNYEKRGSLYVPQDTPIKEKGWTDILYAVSGNKLEEWDISTTDSFRDNYIINRGISLIATNFAQVPLRVYRGEQEIPENHEINNMFITPSEDVSRFELWEKTLIYFYNDGEAFWYLNLQEGSKRIYSIHTLNPRFMKHKKNKQTGQIESWVFNDKIPMPKEQVIHFKFPNTKGLRGLSPIQTVLMEYAADTYAAKYQKVFFENFAKIGGFLKTPKDGTVNEDQLKRVVRQWNATHQGSDNAYKIAGLLGGMEYVETGMSQREMEYIEGRAAIRDRIMTALGVNKTVMGISDDVNRANAKEGMRQLWTLTIKPQLIRYQEKLNSELFNPYFPGYHCKFDLSDIDDLKGDLNITLESAQKMLHMGYTRNEINERLNLDMPDTNDGDDLLPLNLIRREENSLEIEPIEPKKEAKIDKIVDILTKTNTKSRQSLYRRNFNRQQLKHEKQFQTKVKKYFFEQRKEVLKIVSNSKHIHNLTNNLSKFFTNNEDDRLRKVTKPLYISAGETAVELARSTLGVKSIKKDMIDPDILLTKLNKIVGINITVYNQIKMEIFEGANAGESLDQIAKRIKGVYVFAKVRSKLIAITETASMMNTSAFKEYGNEGVQKKEWIANMDESTRDTHANNFSVGPVPMNHIYSNGMKFPGDSGPASEVCNCRCAIAPYIE